MCNSYKKALLYMLYLKVKGFAQVLEIEETIANLFLNFNWFRFIHLGQPSLMVRYHVLANSLYVSVMSDNDIVFCIYIYAASWC